MLWRIFLVLLSSLRELVRLSMMYRILLCLWRDFRYLFHFSPEFWKGFTAFYLFPRPPTRTYFKESWIYLDLKHASLICDMYLHLGITALLHIIQQRWSLLCLGVFLMYLLADALPVLTFFLWDNLRLSLLYYSGTSLWMEIFLIQSVARFLGSFDSNVKRRPHHSS